MLKGLFLCQKDDKEKTWLDMMQILLLQLLMLSIVSFYLANGKQKVL